MSACHKKCEFCDGGEAMNNIPLETVYPTHTYLAQDDCVDCGEQHTPGPCIKCQNCDQAYYLNDLSIRSDSTYICSSCDLVQQGLDTANQCQQEFPWGKLVNK